MNLDKLSDTVPAAVVILAALGMTTWLAGRVIGVLDRLLTRADERGTALDRDPDTPGSDPELDR